MLLGEIEPRSRVRVGVSRTAQGDQRYGARVLSLEILLRIAGPVPAYVVEITAQRGAVAGVAGEDGPQFAIRIGHEENRQVAIRGAVLGAAVGGKTSVAQSPAQLCRPAVRKGIESYCFQRVGNVSCVTLDVRLFLGRDRPAEDVRRIALQPRSGMRMCRAEGNPVGLDVLLLLEPAHNLIAHIGRHTAIIHRDEDGRLVLVASDGQCLRPEMLGHALGFLLAGRIADQADRVIRGDVYAGDAHRLKLAFIRSQCGE